MLFSESFWVGKKVLVTGHTGFKGSWLCLWLHQLGAEVTGYGLEPKTMPNLFTVARISEVCRSVIGDIRNRELLLQTLHEVKPEIIIHMAAQSLVRYSYQNPVETFEVNVMGTVNLLDAVREAFLNQVSIRSVLNVTTDKCYENREWVWGYRESDVLGGYDPYSNSKACSELITSSYRNSFFDPRNYEKDVPIIATARAGNVIGGGDWSNDRIVPDSIRALTGGAKLVVRNPSAIRPWQHVLEPLSGYLLLSQAMYEQGNGYAGAWNFGPVIESEQNVAWIVERIGDYWDSKDFFTMQTTTNLHESMQLRLDSSKARQRLGWVPKWNLETGLRHTLDWYWAYQHQADMQKASKEQIESFMALDWVKTQNP